MIRDNVNRITAEIHQTCIEANRTPSEVKLIAVSKNFDVPDILEAYNAGIRRFGENKAQEMKSKADQLNLGFEWHFIGHLQTNKVKYIIDKVKYIHSIDSLKLAETVNKFADNRLEKLNVLLEIKTSDEATKYGLSTDKEIYEVAEFCKQSANLNLKGLMTIAPFTDDAGEIRRSLIALRQLGDRMNRDGFEISEYSMGMTSDFKIAIEEGATFIRIGTAIFGERNYL
ncbi:MAG: YggS family pyridoxal phosphate-dependent enzyme [Ignavibacteriaceae bacterium]